MIIMSIISSASSMPRCWQRQCSWTRNYQLQVLVNKFKSVENHTKKSNTHFSHCSHQNHTNNKYQHKFHNEIKDNNNFDILKYLMAWTGIYTRLITRKTDVGDWNRVSNIFYIFINKIIINAYWHGYHSSEVLFSCLIRLNGVL